MQSPKLKIVPDAGFYIAALKDGYARTYLVGKGSRCLSCQLFNSEPILLEVQEKFENKFGFDRPTVVTAMSDIRKVVRVIYPTKVVNVVRDPDDNKILECAIEAEADVVLSFDKDLLDLKKYNGIKIVHPAALKYWLIEND